MAILTVEAARLLSKWAREAVPLSGEGAPCLEALGGTPHIIILLSQYFFLKGFIKIQPFMEYFEKGEAERRRGMEKSSLVCCAGTCSAAPFFTFS